MLRSNSKNDNEFFVTAIFTSATELFRPVSARRNLHWAFLFALTASKVLFWKESLLNSVKALSSLPRSEACVARAFLIQRGKTSQNKLGTLERL